MTAVRDEIVQRMWHGTDPLGRFPVRGVPLDKSGWNSEHPYLAQAVEEVRPRVVIEVGVWKGGSVITLAQAVERLQLDAAVIAIDTWLGSSEHWLDPTAWTWLNVRDGYPTLFETFANNVATLGLSGIVVPLPIDSVNAFHVLERHGFRPDVLHIDAGHDYRSVTSDLEMWWPKLSPGGILVGDDYIVDGSIWPEVKRAFDDFFRDRPDRVSFEADNSKCMVRKAR